MLRKKALTMRSILALSLTLSFVTLTGCTHTLKLRDTQALSEKPLSPGTLIVLSFENKTDGVYEDGFWFESVENPVPQLSSLYHKRMESSGLFAEVKFQDRSLAELLKAPGALKSLKQPVYILSGEVSHFRSQMHAHWYAFLIPTSFLTAFGFPFPPVWGACDIKAKFQLTRWEASENPSMTTDLHGRAYRGHFGATYWTEHILFRDLVEQASNQTVQAMTIGVKHSLFPQKLQVKSGSELPKKANK